MRLLSTRQPALTRVASAPCARPERTTCSDEPACPQSGLAPGLPGRSESGRNAQVAAPRPLLILTLPTVPYRVNSSFSHVPEKEPCSTTSTANRDASFGPRPSQSDARFRAARRRACGRLLGARFYAMVPPVARSRPVLGRLLQVLDGQGVPKGTTANRHKGSQRQVWYVGSRLVPTCMGGEAEGPAYAYRPRIGSLVRIGPNELVTDDPEVLRRMMAVRSQYTRGPCKSTIILRSAAQRGSISAE